VAARLGRGRRGPATDDSRHPAVAEAERRIRFALLIGIVVGGIVFVAVGVRSAHAEGATAPFAPWLLRLGPPAVFGFAQAFAPLAGAAAVLLALLLLPASRSAAPSVRTASLEPRSPNPVHPRHVAGLAVPLALLVAFAAAFATTTTEAGSGTFAVSILVSKGATTNEGPAFGWVFVAGLALAAALVATLAVVTERRLATPPSLGDAALAQVVRALRRRLARFTVTVAAAGGVLSLGSLLWSVGSVTLDVAVFPGFGECRATSSSTSQCSQVALDHVQPFFGVSLVEIAAGALAVALGITLVLWATLQDREAQEAAPANADRTPSEAGIPT
jgi:hypothetical protein